MAKLILYYRHNITEILLKVALNTIKPKPIHFILNNFPTKHGLVTRFLIGWSYRWLQPV